MTDVNSNTGKDSGQFATLSPTGGGARKVGGLSAALLGAIGLVVAATINVEGAYVNNPNDPGGATNHGITEKVARQKGYTGHMKDLTKQEAASIYGEDYVIKPNFHLVLAESQALGHKIVDTGANMGPQRPSCWFQESLNSLNRQGKDFPDLKVDCKLGPATIGAYKKLVAKRGSRGACEVMLKLMDGLQASEYLRLTKSNGKLEEFQYGWIQNRVGLVKAADCAKGGV